MMGSTANKYGSAGGDHKNLKNGCQASSFAVMNCSLRGL